MRIPAERAKWFTLVAACFALFMAILDNLVVNIALPTISRDLNASTTQLQWIVSAYTLVFASIQITAGGLGDRLGRKRWFLFGLGLFTSASLFGALSQNITMLIAARAIQGLGAAFIMPLTLSLISVAFPPEERAKALGIWSAISVSGLAFGPIIGGALVQYANWHWVFIINIPIGIVAFIVSVIVVKESRDETGDIALDIPGTVLITAAIGSLTWALIEAGERGWGDTLILAAFGVAAVSLAAFIVVESRVARPMVPLRFFRSSTFTGANIDAFAVSFLIAGVSFFTTLYQQNVHGFSPVRAGLALLPLVIMMMLGAPISAQLVGRVGARSLISIGMVIAGIGTLLMLRLTADSPYITIVPALMVMGAGMSLIFAPMTTAVLNSVETAKSGVASAVNGAVREVGTAFGIALLGTIANRTYLASYDAAPDIIAARANPSLASARPLLDRIGGGISYAGRVVEQLPQAAQLGPLAGQIRIASAEAFVKGMDRAFLVSSISIFVMSVLSFFLLRDAVVKREPVAVGGETTPALSPAYAGMPSGQPTQGEWEPAYANGFAPAQEYAPVNEHRNGTGSNGNGNGYATYEPWQLQPSAPAMQTAAMPNATHYGDTAVYSMENHTEPLGVLAPIAPVAPQPLAPAVAEKPVALPPPGTTWTDSFLIPSEMRAYAPTVTNGHAPAGAITEQNGHDEPAWWTEAAETPTAPAHLDPVGAVSDAEVETLRRRVAELEPLAARVMELEQTVRTLATRVQEVSRPAVSDELLTRRVAELEHFAQQLPHQWPEDQTVRIDETVAKVNALEAFAWNMPIREIREHMRRETELAERVASLERFARSVSRLPAPQPQPAQQGPYVAPSAALQGQGLAPNGGRPPRR